MQDWEFDNTFRDTEGMLCTVTLSLSTVRKFAKETKLPLDGFVPGRLGYDEMLMLCYMGTQHHAEFQKMTLDEFCDERLSGEAFTGAMVATSNSMVNFTLGQMKLVDRLKLAKQMKQEESSQEVSSEKEEGAES